MMTYVDLTQRERQVLKALIDHYIAYAEPVGSRVLAKRYGFGLSPATIRNTIKDLEEMELVDQPHTSAGRVPTTRGYRLYVDYLLRPEKLAKSVKETIKKNLTKEFTGIDQVLEQTSRVLAMVSKQLGITLSPRFESGILTKLELIMVAERRVLVVLAMKSGLARTVLIEVESELSDRGLAETAAILNERLRGLTIGEIKRTIKERLSSPTSGDPKLIRMFIESAEEFLSFSEDAEVHIGGARNLLKQPEFRNPDSVRELIDLVERRQNVYELVSRAGTTDGTTVTIGVGNIKRSGKDSRAEQLSLLSSTYSAGKVRGIVGIIGPTRMPYSKLIAVLDYTARRLSEILSQ